MKKVVSIYYLLTLFLLFIYSYSQIDLNLTLFSFKPYQELQKILIDLGYFNRPLSTAIYIFILLSLSLTYFFLLRLVKEKKINLGNFWCLVFLTSFVVFSYPAFSHDLFNYMFDARIVTKYGLNPYHFKALDFPDDLWIRFMHWTHRTYPYGPLWLIISLPFSFLGFQKFTLTFFWFKLLFALVYLVNVYLIFWLVKKSSQDSELYAASFFAFNPLIIIESLVSPHNDSLMLLFCLLSLYFFIRRKKIISIVLMLASVGIKFMTLPLLLFQLINLFFKKNILNFLPLIYLISLLPLIYLRELLPWYFVPFLGLSALVLKNNFWRIFNLIMSSILLLKYVSFLQTGEWTKSAYHLFIGLVVGAASLIILFSEVVKSSKIKL